MLYDMGIVFEESSISLLILLDFGFPSSLCLTLLFYFMFQANWHSLDWSYFLVDFIFILVESIFFFTPSLSLMPNKWITQNLLNITTFIKTWLKEVSNSL